MISGATTFPSFSNFSRQRFTAKAGAFVANLFSCSFPALRSALVSYQLCCGGAVVGPSAFFVREEKGFPKLSCSLMMSGTGRQRVAALASTYSSPTTSVSSTH